MICPIDNNHYNPEDNIVVTYKVELSLMPSLNLFTKIKELKEGYAKQFSLFQKDDEYKVYYYQESENEKGENILERVTESINKEKFDNFWEKISTGCHYTYYGLDYEGAQLELVLMFDKFHKEADFPKIPTPIAIVNFKNILEKNSFNAPNWFKGVI